MKRRAFLAGMTLPLLPSAGSAEQGSLPIVAFITPGQSPSTKRYFDALRRGLLEMGLVEHRAVAVEHHHFERRLERLPEVVGALVERRVAVICTITNVVALSVKSATSDIPLVFAVGLDPVAMGLAKAFDRPEGNATGIYFPVTALDSKRLELARELLPRERAFGVVVNPTNPNATHLGDLRATANQLGLSLLISNVQEPDEIDPALQQIKKQGAAAVLVTSDPIFEAYRARLFEAAARNVIPAVYPWREYVDAGGLLSYGNDLTDAARLVGRYAGRILKGDKPGDLPVEMQTKYELLINLKTAKALGLSIPPTLLARADEVIE